jgi:hypothetical protein
MTSDETIKTKPQEVITLFRDIEDKNNERPLIHYPELEDLFQKGFYVESFNQTIIGTDRLIITFILRKFNATTF